MRSARSISAIAAVVIATAVSVPAQAVAVRLIPNLTSITFYERTGGVAPTPFTFAVNSPELAARLADPLGAGNHDIPGAATEFYDVFYSNADGSFNPNGEFLTIEGVYLFGLPQGGGLNLAEIALNFSGGAPSEFGSFVASSAPSATTRFRATSASRSTATCRRTRQWATRSGRRSACA